MYSAAGTAASTPRRVSNAALTATIASAQTPVAVVRGDLAHPALTVFRDQLLLHPLPYPLLPLPPDQHPVRAQLSGTASPVTRPSSAANALVRLSTGASLMPTSIATIPARAKSAAVMAASAAAVQIAVLTLVLWQLHLTPLLRLPQVALLAAVARLLVVRPRQRAGQLLPPLMRALQVLSGVLPPPLSASQDWLCCSRIVPDSVLRRSPIPQWR